MLKLRCPTLHADGADSGKGKGKGKGQATASMLSLALSLALPNAMSDNSGPSLGFAAASASQQAQARFEGRQQSVDLNSASAEQLASVLVGVGAAKAHAIIRYRDEVGPFRSVEELEEVKGIGPSIVKRNKTRIRVKTPKS